MFQSIDDTSAPPRQLPRHLPFLDGMRACAALLVIFHHAWQQSWPVHYPSLVQKPTGILGLLINWLSFGKLAVTAFIVISGFSLMLSIVRGRHPFAALPFLVKRCKRILPPYYAALLLAVLLDCFVLHHPAFTMYDMSFPLTPFGIWSHLFLFQNLTRTPFQIAGHLWSISVEFQIYLFFPLLVLLYRRAGIAAVLCTTSVSGILMDLALTRAGLEINYAHYFVVFGFGMAAVHFAFTLSEHEVRRALRFCLFALPGVLLLGLAARRVLGFNPLVNDTLFGAVVAMLLFVLTTTPQGALSRIFSVRPLAWIGTFSYSLYLVHFPLQQLFWQVLTAHRHLSRPVTFLIVSTAGTALILVAAYGFFWVCERPYFHQNVTRAPMPSLVPLADSTLSL